MKAAISFTLAALMAVSTQAVSVQALLSSQDTAITEFDEEAVFRTLHIIDMDGDALLSEDEIIGILALAWSQGRITLL